MSPRERMAALYAAHPQECAFEYYLDWYDANGHIFDTPEYFVVGRPVMRFAPTELICNLWPFRREDCDCWYVMMLAGDMGAAWGALPFWLPWMAFERIRPDGGRRLTFLRTGGMQRITTWLAAANSNRR